MPFFCRSGHPVVTVGQFLEFVDPFQLQEAELDLLRITGQDLLDNARAKKSTAGGLDGWAWNEIEALPKPWFSRLAILLHMVDTTGIWPQGPLDAYIAMIPKADGDSTPLGQRPLSVLPVVYRLWASLGLGHLKDWVLREVSRSVCCLGNGLSSVETWFSTALDIEEVLSGLVGISFISWLLMLLSHLTLLIVLFWIVLWAGLGFLHGLERFTFLFMIMFVLDLSLLLVLGSLGAGMGEFLRDVLLLCFSLLHCMFPVVGCRRLEIMPAVRPQLYADNLKCSAERPGLPGSHLSMFRPSVRMCPLGSVFYSVLLRRFARS